MCTQIHTCKQSCVEVSVMVASLWYFNTITSHKLKYLTCRHSFIMYLVQLKNVFFEVNIRINKLWNCEYVTRLQFQFQQHKIYSSSTSSSNESEKHSYSSHPDYITLQNMHLCASLFIWFLSIYFDLYCNACATLLWLRLAADTSQTSHMGLLKHLSVCLCCELQLKHYIRLSAAVQKEHVLVQGKTPPVNEVKHVINTYHYPIPVH